MSVVVAVRFDRDRAERTPWAACPTSLISSSTSRRTWSESLRCGVTLIFVPTSCAETPPPSAPSLPSAPRRPPRRPPAPASDGRPRRSCCSGTFSPTLISAGTLSSRGCAASRGRPRRRRRERAEQRAEARDGDSPYRGGSANGMSGRVRRARRPGALAGRWGRRIVFDDVDAAEDDARSSGRCDVSKGAPPCKRRR